MARDSETAASSARPYDRGVAHLKRGENAEAVAAFTEAIGLDAEAPNAYVGRALAYRALGEQAAAERDEKLARDLGGPEGSVWDRLVRRAHRRWRGDLRDLLWAREDALSRDAFLLRQWTWQIYNGGLPQWVANGYGEWADDLVQAVERVATDSARAVAAVVREVARILAAWPGGRETMFRMIATGYTDARVDELFGTLADCEERYYRAEGHASQFTTEVEEFLERRAARAG